MKENSNKTLISSFYKKHRDDLVNYAANRLENNEEAEDVVQDAIIRMLDYSDMISEVTVKAFAYRITYNIVMDHLRRRSIRWRIEDNIKAEMILQYSNAEWLAESHETMRVINMGMSRLSPARCKVMTMILMEDMSISDVSTQLNLSKRTVETHIFASRREMRKYISEELEMVREA